MAGAATALRLGVALALAGFLLASPILLLPGAAILLVVGGCAAGVRFGSAGVQVRRGGMPHQVTEGERFDVVIDGVSGWLPLLCRIEDPAVGAAGAASGAPSPERIQRPARGLDRAARAPPSRPRRRCSSPIRSAWASAGS